ncbi:MAG: hypothetical protein ACOYOB_09515 [Myxococcota bacterium]
MKPRDAFRRVSLIAATEVARLGSGLARRALAWAQAHLTTDDALAMTDRYFRRTATYRQRWHAELGLFDFERAAIDTHFPKPPSRLLVLGMGGGRDGKALQERGYEVDGCEPVQALAGRAQQELGAGAEVIVCRAEDLDVRGVLAGPYAGVVFGWGAWSHLFTADARRAALVAARRRVPLGAPLLLSWPAAPVAGLRNGARGTLDMRRGGAQRSGVVETGVLHGWRLQTGGIVHLVYSREDLELEAAATGWRTVDVQGSESGYPHAVLTAMEMPDAVRG